MTHATPQPVYGVVRAGRLPVRASPPSVATPTARPRSGARSRAIPATPGTATSIATSASTCRPSTCGTVRRRRPPARRTGLKYHRVTGHADADKEPYDPDARRGAGRASTRRTSSPRAGRSSRALRARPWTARRSSSAPTMPSSSATGGSRGRTGSTPSCGRWPPRPDSRRSRLSDDLDRAPGRSSARRRPRARGAGGGTTTSGCSPANDWIYPHLHARRRAPRPAVPAHASPAAHRRAARSSQALRELLLAQASDWAFMMARGTTAEYADRRTTEHLLGCQHALRRGRARHARRCAARGARGRATRSFPRSISTSSPDVPLSPRGRSRTFRPGSMSTALVALVLLPMALTLVVGLSLLIAQPLLRPGAVRHRARSPAAGRAPAWHGVTRRSAPGRWKRRCASTRRASAS